MARALAAYGALRLPLALLELPLFVLLPALYGATLGLPLAWVGAVLFAARLLDALADPWLGRRIAASRARHGYRPWVLGALPVLAAGYGALLFPPALSPAALAAWLGAASVLTYLAYSTVCIAHAAWGAELGHDDGARARVVAWREGFGLVGVIVASALLVPERRVELASSFALSCAIGAWALVRHAPGLDLDGVRPDIARAVGASNPPGASTRPDAAAAPGAGAHPLSMPAFRRLLAAFVVNAVASAVPATLVLLFVRDVLQAETMAPAFLLAYFGAAMAGLPGWVWLGRRLGLRRAWLASMLATVAVFACVPLLGPGDIAAFAAVCALSGLALGADLALPAAALASTLARAGLQQQAGGAFFGWWTLASKLSLALAAGLALPLLGLLGYEPGAPDAGGESAAFALALVYAALPCTLKLAAAAVLAFHPYDDETAPT